MSEYIPRPEYPRPSWVRDDFLNLNGTWDFAIDLYGQYTLENVPFNQKITVPFPPESTLSGIGETGFMEVVWYRKEVQIPERWQGKRILLHFQAVDYDAEIFIDGKTVCFHRGCFTPFTVDLGVDPPRQFSVTVRACTLRDRNRARGKQSDRPENYLCCYTRVSGIWQTVWMEAVPEVFMKRSRVLPTADGFLLTVPLSANRRLWKVEAEVLLNGESICHASVPADAGLSAVIYCVLPEDKRIYWSPENPQLYDIELTLTGADGSIIDRASTYGGWRFISIDGMDFLLNGKKLFQKLVLDQGYYPDGIWTAPDDEALQRDIHLSMQAGFNGARLHQKVFEERFLYHADRLGYLVWGEFGDWGIDWCQENQPDAGSYQPGISPAGQFLEEIERDFSHPCIIVWSALNETHRRMINGKWSLDVVNDLIRTLFNAAKTADPSRPVLDVSGYIHRLPESDIYDIHDYGTADEVASHLAVMDPPCQCDPNGERDFNELWHGQPFFLSEIGGMAYPPPPPGSFSYGDPPATADEFLARFRKLIAEIRRDKRVSGYCYTQLTDIFQEANGLYYFDRQAKFDPAELAAAQADHPAGERD